MESFEHAGYFWLPCQFEDRVSGKLLFNPQYGGALELRIEGFYDHTNFDNEVYPIILGVVNATEFSLINCRKIGGEINLKINFSDQKIVFDIETIFEGHHFGTIDDIKFEFVRSSYTYLDDWMDQRNFRFEDGGVSYSQPELTTIQLEDKSISFGAGVSESISRTEVVLKEACGVIVTPNEERPFNEYRQLVDIQLPNFLTLATGMPNYASNVRTELTNNDMPKEINIYYRVPGYVVKPRSIPTEHMLFTFEDVKNSPSKYLPNWIKKSVELQSVYDLYHQTIYSRLIHFRTRFLLLAQALEAYHRNLYDEKYQPKPRYKQAKRCLKRAIPEWIEGEHRNNLKASIDHGNDFSLKTRIVKICDSILRDYFVNGTVVIVDVLIGDVDEFAEKVKDTRNYLTHHPKKRSKKVLSDDEIVEYIPKMLLLLRICLLVELRCPPEKIKDQVIRNPDFKRVTGHW